MIEVPSSRKRIFVSIKHLESNQYLRFRNHSSFYEVGLHPICEFIVSRLDEEREHEFSMYQVEDAVNLFKMPYGTYVVTIHDTLSNPTSERVYNISEKLRNGTFHNAIEVSRQTFEYGDEEE